MIVGMADIPVLHSAEVAQLYPQDVFPFSPRVERTLKHFQSQLARAHCEAFAKCH
jgi:hypothetical protein